MFRYLDAATAMFLALAGPTIAAEWHVVSLNGAPVAGDATIGFDAGGAVWGSTGCNRFNARGAMSDGNLVVAEPIATTRAACPGEALDRQERILLEALRTPLAVRYELFSDRVSLTAGPTTLELAAQAQAPDAGTPELPRPHLGRDRPTGTPPYLGVFGRAGDLPIRAAATADAAAVTAVPSGTVLRNDGCADGWCRVELPDGSAGGWAEAQYLEPADSALRAGQGIFDATGLIPCAKGAGAPMGDCVFGVARDGEGSGTVMVDTPAGIRRALFFREGAFVSTDASEAAGGFDATARKEADLSFVRIDDERFEIPDAVLFGG